MIAVPSGRSGGVVDDVVMDFSVGLEVPLQKNGAPVPASGSKSSTFCCGQMREARVAASTTFHHFSDSDH